MVKEAEKRPSPERTKAEKVWGELLTATEQGTAGGLTRGREILHNAGRRRILTASQSELGEVFLELISRRGTAGRERLPRERDWILLTMIGPVGSGKTTLKTALDRAFGENSEGNREPFGQNPFWAESYARDKKTRVSQTFWAQLYFAIHGVRQETELRPRKGKVITMDASFQNNQMHVAKAQRLGLITPEEESLCERTFRQLEGLIHVPDLLIALTPDNLEHLQQGIARRARREEVGTISREELEVMICEAERITAGLAKHQPILRLRINPMTIFPPESRESQKAVMAVREFLDLPQGLIKPSPMEVATAIGVQIGQERGARRLFLVDWEEPSFLGEGGFWERVSRLRGKTTVIFYQGNGKAEEGLRLKKRGLNAVPVNDGNWGKIAAILEQTDLSPAELVIGISGIDRIGNSLPLLANLLRKYTVIATGTAGGKETVKLLPLADIFPRMVCSYSLGITGRPRARERDWPGNLCAYRRMLEKAGFELGQD